MREVDVECRLGTLGILEALYEKDPLYVYRHMRSLIEEVPRFRRNVDLPFICIVHHIKAGPGGEHLRSKITVRKS